MKKIVRHVLHDHFDLLAGHLPYPGMRIGQAGVIINVLHCNLLAREKRDAPAEARRESYLRVVVLPQRVENKLIEAPVEMPAAVQEAFGDREFRRQLAFIRRANFLDERCHLRVFWQEPRQDGDELVAVIDDLAAAYIQVQTAQKFPMRSRVDNYRLLNEDRFRDAIVGMAAEDDIDALHSAGELEVYIEPVVAQNHDEVDLVSEFVHQLLQAVFLDPEGGVWHKAVGMRYCRIREGLTDDADLDATDLLERVGMKYGVSGRSPGDICDIMSDEISLKKARCFPISKELAHALHAVGKLPMWSENFYPQLIRRLEHVEAPAPERGR